MSEYETFHDESDADDEYERSLKSPRVADDSSSSPTDSEGPLSTEITPTSFNRNAALPSPSGLMTRWNADQCADCIANLGFEQYADAFADADIDGETLCELMQEELKELGVASVGHRLTILRSIYDLKVQQNIPILPDQYMPISADANAPENHATQDDVIRIINQIQLRDQRLVAAEEDLRILREDLNRALEESRRLREDILPLIRMAKDKSQPLPTPEGLPQHTDLPSPQPVEQPKPASLSRKFSTKKLFLGATKAPSPTIQEPASLDPSAAAKAASSQLTASVTSQSAQPSPRSPASPPYAPSYRGAPSSRFAPTSDDGWNQSTSSASTLAADPRASYVPSSRRVPPASASQGRQESQPRKAQQGNPDAAAASLQELVKSFKLSNDAPCSAVLPLALQRYHIEESWQQYSLFIVYGDQEQRLALDDKPLVLFKRLISDGHRPMFMLRRNADDVQAGGSPAGTGFVGRNAGGSLPGRASYQASSVQLPGGVL